VLPGHDRLAERLGRGGGMYVGWVGAAYVGGWVGGMYVGG
jgi:hypothetical protein